MELELATEDLFFSWIMLLQSQNYKYEVCDAFETIMTLSFLSVFVVRYGKRAIERYLKLVFFHL